MAFTDMDDFEEDVEEEGGEERPPEESSNRTFIIVAVLLGALTLLALLCTAAYAFFFLPQLRASRDAQVATVNAQLTQVAMEVTQTAIAFAFTPTPTQTEIARPTNTPLLVDRSTATPTVDPAQATAESLLTEVAQAQLTQIPTSTLLPDSGFADDVGAPGLLILGVVLVGVIFLVRRLRAA